MAQRDQRQQRKGRPAPGGPIRKRNCYFCREKITEVDYKNANQTFDYIKKNMPPEKGGSLSDEDYWAITAFLVKKNDIPIASPLTSSNAQSVTWSR